MLKKTIIAAGALIAATVATVPANAANFSLGFSTPQGSFYIGSQPYGHQWRGQRHVLPARAIINRLHSQGYRRVANLRRHGNVYVARAFHPRRGWVVVRANAYDGRLIHVASR